MILIMFDLFLFLCFDVQYCCIESIVMLMYLDCFKCKGKPYLRIVENYTIVENGIKKSKRKTIKNLGYLENLDDGQPDFIKRMKEKLTSLIKNKKI